MNRGLVNYQQGMLLKPQHFQLQDHLIDHRFHVLGNLLQPYLYGVDNVDISTDALTNCRITVNVGTFLFADGTYAVLGQNAVISSRQIPDELLESGDIISVYVGVRRFSDMGGNARVFDDAIDQKCDSRYVTQSGGEVINDLYGGSLSGNVEFLKYNLKVFFGSELEVASDFVVLKVAEVYRDGSRIMFNDDYAPPVVNLYRSEALRTIMSDISALIISKTRVFEKYKHLRNSTKLTAYDTMLIGLIRSLCTCSAKVQTMQELQQSHPCEVWRELATIVSVLSVSCDDISAVVADNRYPSYDHNNLFAVFSKMREQIRVCLNCLSVGPEYIIRFDRGENGVWNAKLPDLTKLESYDVFLAMSGRDVEPDKLSLSFWRQLKLSSTEAMKDLIVRSLSGIPITVSDGNHGGLPTLDRGFYSTVDKNNDLWLDAVENRSLSMLWNGPDDAELILYIVRNY